MTGVQTCALPISDAIDPDPLTGGGKQAAVLANAPAAMDGFYGVPKVIE